MIKKLEQIVELIEEALEYNEPDDNRINIYATTFLRSELTQQDLEWGFKKLQNDGLLVRKQIMYGANKPQPTYPAIHAHFIGTPNNTYDQVVYVLYIDLKKLNALPVKPSDESKFVDDNNEALIKIGSIIISLPPHENEHWLCKGVFKHAINEPVDWEELYEEMTGYYKDFFGKPQNKRQSWRIVYDAMRAVNKRVKENSLDPLFRWQNKTIKRCR
jgi:hypothetical protein